MAGMLSHLSGIGVTLGTSNSVSNLDNQANSAVTLLMLLYSTSALQQKIGKLYVVSFTSKRWDCHPRV